MEFRLIYQGPLQSTKRSQTRAYEKHVIRKYFHKQLALLWQSIPHLRNRLGHKEAYLQGARTTGIKKLGNVFSRCGYRFVPLVSKDLDLACGLDILFLRRDMPGVSVVKSGGDLDNRLKTLLDALRMPQVDQEVDSFVREPDEEPFFFCLLEDDSLIADMTVTTDRLLSPLPTVSPSASIHDVVLIIKIKIRPTDLGMDNLDFA